MNSTLALAECCDPTHGETYWLGKEFSPQLINNYREVLRRYVWFTFPSVSRMEVTSAGDIVYTKVVRENVPKLAVYVEEMVMGGAVPGTIDIQSSG
jgi:fatty acid synthase subunit alpha, fungi type/fatty acid synthase subunit beta, fungi type